MPVAFDRRRQRGRALVSQPLIPRFVLVSIAFTMYGGFWMSFATIYIPGSGVIDAYENSAGVLDAAQLDSAVGIYLMTWFIVTFLLLCV